MKAQIVGLLAETSIHVGAGQSAGFVDLPVAREAATDYPVIAGSGLKGALSDLARQRTKDEDWRNSVFGTQKSAGEVLVSDARLLLLPVRSLNSHYMWVTCPHIVERFVRDLRRTGHEPAIEIARPPAGSYFGPRDTGTLYLEERQFDQLGELPGALVDVISSLLLHKDTASRLTSQLVVLSDRDFVWFARYGLAITARNVLDRETKESTNLWYEESLPADTLFYTLLAERTPGHVDKALSMFRDQPYLQVGGNETVGQGWFVVRPVSRGGDA